MTDVKWIKFKVGTFDGKSFKKIKRAKIGGESYRDKLTAIWFELMDFAGKCNHSGAFIDSHEIPFASLDDIAIMIDREPDELELCMRFFINEGMVEVTNDVYTLSNWAVYQSEDKLERIRENNRARQARFRDKKKLLLEAAAASNEQDNGGVTLRNAIDKEEDKDKEQDKEHIGETDETPAPPAPAPSPKEDKSQKHKHGEYKNVLLTDQELEKLQEDYPDWAARIERLSSYIASTGKRYKSHYATIRNWASRDGATGRSTQPGRKEPVPDWIDKPKASPIAMAAVQKMLAEENPELSARVEALKERINSG